jgi:hypothetical protein
MGHNYCQFQTVIMFHSLIKGNLYCYLNTVYHLVIKIKGLKLILTQRATQSMNKLYLHMHLGSGFVRQR